MQKRAADAIAPLQAAAQSLRDAETDTLLAMALRQTGRTEEALARLKRATKRRPPYAPAFHELGYLLMSLENYDEAIEALRRGLEIAPMMPQLSVQLGEVFCGAEITARPKRLLPERSKSRPISPRRCSVWPRRINRSASTAGRRLLSPLPRADTRRRRVLAQSRPLSLAARADRSRLRLLPHRRARRSEALRQSAHLARRIRPRPALAQAKRGGAIFQGSKR